MILVWAIKQKFNDLSEGDLKKQTNHLDDSAKASQPPLERVCSKPLVTASSWYQTPVAQPY